MPATAPPVHKALGRAASLADDVKKHGDAVLFRAFSMVFHPFRRGSFYFLLADGAPPLLRKGAAAMEKADEISSFLGAAASKLPFEEP